ncbi:MAG: hypothetical protein H0U95_18325 [Bacteroidetes bacterium]|nr:hypothetical protein [Bacteroidota bacterium]
MRLVISIVVFVSLVFSQKLIAQSLPFKENSKWGIIENDKVVIRPVYDTVFNFDTAGKICLACFKAKGPSANKFIKTVTVTYACNYLNKSGEKLNIKTEGADTCSVFSLGKLTVKQYTENPNYFIVSSKSKKYLVNKDLSQTLLKGYHEIYLTAEPKYIITEIKTEEGIVYTGLINFKAEEIIPYHYSGIKINNKDSVIVACSAGVGNNGDDDIYDYQGKKIKSYKRHVDMATKNFVIYKIFEPKEYYILLNLKNKEETIFTADEVTPFERDEVLLRTKNEWFVFDLASKQRKPYKK